MFAFLFNRRERRRRRAVAEALYHTAVAQARQPAFYRALGVPDTWQGRFEMVALHTWLLLRRLKAGGPGEPAELAQAVFDAMFRDMDANLRELGTSDIGMGRRIRRLAESFYGRMAAYDDGLDTAETTLAEALARNIHGDDPGPAARALADYVARTTAALDAQPLDALIKGDVHFTESPDEPESDR